MTGGTDYELDFAGDNRKDTIPEEGDDATLRFGHWHGARNSRESGHERAVSSAGPEEGPDN